MEKGGKTMDKLSVLAGLLYLTDIEENKNIAVQLLNGDLSLKLAQKMPRISTYLKEFELNYKDGIDEETQQKIIEFVEEFLYEVAW